MEIPSLDELLERRSARKKRMKEMFNGDKYYKSLFKQEETQLETYIEQNFINLDQVDQELITSNSMFSKIYLFLGFTPLIILATSTYIIRPNFTRLQKFALWMPAALVFPYLSISTCTYNSLNIQFYLMEKYRERLMKTIVELSTSEPN